MFTSSTSFFYSGRNRLLFRNSVSTDLTRPSSIGSGMRHVNCERNGAFSHNRGRVPQLPYPAAMVEDNDSVQVNCGRCGKELLVRVSGIRDKMTIDCAACERLGPRPEAAATGAAPGLAARPRVMVLPTLKQRRRRP